MHNKKNKKNEKSVSNLRFSIELIKKLPKNWGVY